MVESGSVHQDGDQSVEDVLTGVMNEIIDEVALGVFFDIHRACKSGNIFLADTDPESQKEYEVIDVPGVDIFGQAPTRKQSECPCPNCSRCLAASRFAPHLEKCMGMGRNSSRIASRRIANNSTKRDSDDSGEEDNMNDNDWSYNQDTKKSRRMKKDKSVNGSRCRSKTAKYRNGDVNDHAGNPEASVVYETMTLDAKKTFLLSKCGVISETTRKVCIGSIRCTIHTDEERRRLRSIALHPDSLAEALEAETEDIQIDIDSYDDMETITTLREYLHPPLWDVSSNSSPADSTSTNNSTSSRKRGPSTKSTKGGSKGGKKRKTGGKSGSQANSTTTYPGGSATSSSSLTSTSSLPSASLYDFQ